MFKYLFKRDTLAATVLVFVVMGLLALIPINTHVLDPIKMALQDFDYNDLAYAEMHKNAHTGMDTGIVVVNIGYASRSEIVEMLTYVLAAKPLAVGADVVFNSPKEAATDSMLRQLFAENQALVLAYNYIPGSSSGEFLLSSARTKGYANFVGEEGGVIRHFAPFAGKEKIESFDVALARQAYGDAYIKLRERHQSTEIIDYSRGPEKYLVVDGTTLADPTISAALSGKVVLMGYVAESPNDIEDKHFTPLNAKSVGKSVPDMEGVFIHANILSMIREGDYIQRFPQWLNWSVAVLLCWLHMALFIRYFLDHHLWFHLVAKIAQVVSAVLFVYLGLLCFYQFDMQINLSPTFVAIILAVDVLYFYEAICNWLHKKYGIGSIFIHQHH